MTNEAERQKIFAALAESLAQPGAAPVPAPSFASSICVSERRLQAATLWDNFAVNFQAVNGQTMRSLAELSAFLQQQGFRRGYCDPALEEIGAALIRDGIEVRHVFDRETVDEFEFGITRASGAIAESGTLILNDHDTSDRLAALAPWVHVAVLREADLVRTIPDAIARLGTSPNTVWVTGPSKTADIEGILIEGVHGPGVEICLCLG